jgi:hypothetical protein
MIIAHNNDYITFQNILSHSVSDLQKDSDKRPEYYIRRGGVSLEKDVYKIVNKHAAGTAFSEKIELISGQRFPDIVAYVNDNKAYGIEVKTTTSNKWKSTGSSIFEGTRVDDVKNIYLLFGKLAKPIEFRCRKYEECLYDVAITHSPRYLIDMETGKSESIFSKVGVDYDTLRSLDNPFKPIKRFLRKNLKDGEDLWWIDNNDENVRDLSVRLWGNLSQERKEELRISALAHFPILLSNNSKKYSMLATWLVSKFGIVNHALRDTFTAGGQIDVGGIMLPKIFNHVSNNIDEIINIVKTIPEDDISYYWGVDVPIDDCVAEWKKQCLRHCKESLDNRQYNKIASIIGV